MRPHSEAPAKLAVLRPLTPLPAPLPAPRTPLLGRAAELAAVTRVLMRDDVALATLTGAGGSGKTRLAIAVAAGLADRFPDGAVFVDLAAIADPDLVDGAIAQALDLRETAGQPVSESLARYLSTRRMLLVLDNFEQVQAAAPVVAGLLLRCPGVKALVTSRAALRVRGERELVVPPLALPEPGPLPPPAELAHVPAIALFVARAEEVQANFHLDAANAAAVTEICRRLDGLPLAIELAAARIRILSPAALRARLERRLQLLTGGAADLPARQQTLRDAITWSHDLLSPNEQALFRRLAVFAGGCTIEAAEAVAAEITGGDEAACLDLLTSLVDKSLLVRRLPAAVEAGEAGSDTPAHAPAAEPDAAGLARPGEPRFAMLETIREYGLDRLADAGEADDVRLHHAHFFLALAEAAEPHLYHGAREPWLDRLTEEQENLRAAIRWAVEHRQTETALRLVGALARWFDRGMLAEGRRRAEEALALPGAAAWTAARGKALYAAGYAAYELGDHQAARARWEEGAAIWREQRDPRWLARTLTNLGRATRDDYPAACALVEESVAIWRRSGDRAGLAWALNNLGALYLTSGDAGRARPPLEESAAVWQQLGDRSFVAHPLLSLAFLAFWLHDYTTTRARLDECLPIFRRLRDRANIILSLTLLGYMAQEAGNIAESRRWFVESLQLGRELANPERVANSLAGLAAVARLQGRLERAARLFAAAELPWQASGMSGATWYVALYQPKVDAVRADLGDERFQAAWAAARVAPLEAIIDEALVEDGADTRNGSAKDATHPPFVVRTASFAELSARELEVLRLLAAGRSNPEIAGALTISRNTVYRHVSNIFAKIGAANRVEAAAYAHHHGLP